MEADVPPQILHCFYLYRYNIKEEVFILASERYWNNKTAIRASVVNFCSFFRYCSDALLLVDLRHIGPKRNRNSRQMGSQQTCQCQLHRKIIFVHYSPPFSLAIDLYPQGMNVDTLDVNCGPTCQVTSAVVQIFAQQEAYFRTQDRQDVQFNLTKLLQYY